MRVLFTPVGLPLLLCTLIACSKEPAEPGTSATIPPGGPRAAPTVAPTPPPPAPLAAATMESFANLALACVHKEYPNKISHVMNSVEDAQPASALTPAFFGCLDWHSAVHGHWMLARLCRLYPDAPFVSRAREALTETFTRAKMAAEVAYMSAENRETFERPYGLAWLLQLAAELREWDDPQARAWAEVLAPVEAVAAARLMEWLPKLSYPVRVGTHEQTAFALGLVYDWAHTTANETMVSLIAERARHYFLNDRGANLAFEPDGQAFLSPILAEADLMRRILDPPALATWLRAFLPELNAPRPVGWLRPAVVTDRTDAHLVHLDGLNLSRAWMLEGVAGRLPPSDPRVPLLLTAAYEHRNAGIAAIRDQHYEGGHWLGSFATYLATQRGLAPGPR